MDSHFKIPTSENIQVGNLKNYANGSSDLKSKIEPIVSGEQPEADGNSLCQWQLEVPSLSPSPPSRRAVPPAACVQVFYFNLKVTKSPESELLGLLSLRSTFELEVELRSLRLICMVLLRLLVPVLASDSEVRPPLAVPVAQPQAASASEPGA